MEGNLIIIVIGYLYISECNNHRIRKVTVSTGIITTFAGSSTGGSYSGDNGPATSASLYYPWGLALDSAGTTYTYFCMLMLDSFTYLGNVYFSDDNNNRVRKVTISTGIITTFAGTGASDSFSGDNGPATSASFSSPAGLAIDASGNTLNSFLSLIIITFLPLLDNVYIADGGNSRIRKVTVTTKSPR